MGARTAASTFSAVAPLPPAGIDIPCSQSSPTLWLKNDTSSLNSFATRELDATKILTSGVSLPNIFINNSPAIWPEHYQHPISPEICHSRSYYTDDGQSLVYCAPEDFLPSLASTPPKAKDDDTTPALIPPPPDENHLPFRALVTSTPLSVALQSSLPTSLKFSRIADSIARLSENLAASMVARYKKEYPDDYEDDSPDEKEVFHWEEEMLRFERKVRYFER